jgi:phosphomethylpyrimidine synthase
MKEALKGNITDEIKSVAETEGIDVRKIIKGLADGRIVIPKNINGKSRPVGIGKGLKTKINANIGSSSELEKVEWEVEKAKAAVKYGADTIMDLSTGPEYEKVLKAVMETVNIPIGTVPIYEAGITASNTKGAVVNMDGDDMLRAIENQAKTGVDLVNKVKNSNRIMGIVSRGGSFLAAWILKNQEENPLFKNYDYILEVAEEYDVTLSLGDGLRPGCLHDASDVPQIQELVTLGELVGRARDKGVQVMVEGPGHVPINQIKANIEIQKTICKDAPFYVLGPLVTDLAPGYDHITSAIGGAIAAASGADFLCYVTPAEHLAIPNIDDVKEGVIASKIAAEAGDIAKGVNGAWEREVEMAYARKNFDWEKQFELAFDHEKPIKCRERKPISEQDMCTMCGEFCALRLVRDNI